MDNILFSNLRCIKILKTKEDLTAAINKAIAIVSVPREICVRATDISVKVINTASTERRVRYGIIWLFSFSIVYSSIR